MLNASICLNFCGFLEVTKYNIYKDYDIKHRMATIILSNADTPLAKRMTEKLTEFVEVIISNCEGVIEDDQNAAITILNSTEVRIALRREYINYLTKKNIRFAFDQKRLYIQEFA